MRLKCPGFRGKRTTKSLEGVVSWHVRGTKFLPICPTHARSGQARVRVNGRDIYLGPFGSTESKQAYARFIAEHYGNGEPPSLTIPTGEKLSVAALVVKYDDFARSYYVKNGVPTDERYAIKAAVGPLVRLYGETPADEFSPKRLKAVRDQIIADGRKGRGKTEHHGIDKFILLGPKAQEVLTRWLERDPDQYLFSPKEVWEAKVASRRRAGRPSRPRNRRRRHAARPPSDHYNDEGYCQPSLRCRPTETTAGARDSRTGGGGIPGAGRTG